MSGAVQRYWVRYISSSGCFSGCPFDAYTAADAITQATLNASHVTDHEGKPISTVYSVEPYEKHS